MKNALSEAIAEAARLAFSDLYEKTKEDFYYCALVTTGEALPPQVSAWSWQALDRAAATEDDPEMWRRMLKWSYADSPYVDFGAEYFAEVNAVFEKLTPMTEEMSAEEWDREYNFRISEMTNAMQTLSADGLFGRGRDRENLLVIVEVVPPDASNTDRAKMLNKAGSPALTSWIEEAAEPS